MEGEVQARKKSSIAQGIVLAVTFGILLLKRDIGNCQRCTGGHCAASVWAGWFHNRIMFQGMFLLTSVVGGGIPPNHTMRKLLRGEPVKKWGRILNCGQFSGKLKYTCGESKEFLAEVGK